jgi:polyisoprenyl-phosphate glycosyltransferase
MRVRESFERESLTVIVPVFNEREIVARLHAELTSALDAAGLPWNIIYVNDGSSDGTAEALLAVQGQEPRVAVLELSRNWGHQAALTAGLSVASGSAIVMIDGDLQDPPALIPELVQRWREGAEVVIARRRSRAERAWRRAAFAAFYRVLGFLSDFPIPLNAGTYCLLDRKAADAMRALNESNRYLPGLRAWVGFATDVVFYDRQARAAGREKQSFSRLLKFALDAIFSFSYKPIRLMLLFGVVTAAVAVLMSVGFVVLRVLHIGLFGSPVVAGYTSIMVVLLMLGAIQCISVGMLGEYLGRVYDEVKRRPLFIISKVHGVVGDAPERQREQAASVDYLRS